MDESLDFQGTLFLREDGRSWQQVFVTLKDGCMAVHRPDQVGLPTGLLIVVSAREMRRLEHPVGAASLHSRAVMVQSRPHGGCPVPGQHASQRRTEHVFASTDATQHAAFLGQLTAITGSANSSTGRSASGVVSTVFSPSPAVMARLCCPGRECSKQLLQLVKAARAAFEQGVQGLGDAEESALAAQARMMGLYQLLDQVLSTLKESHPVDEQSEADAGALADCKAWASSLQALVMEVDMQLAALGTRFAQVGRAASQEWAELARHTVPQLREVEQFMQAGQAAAANASSGPLGTRRSCASRPCMPYKSYWANKIAI